MSRSRRKTPITGITNSSTEKDDKRLAARRERRWMGARLNPEVASAEEFDLPGERTHHRHWQWVFAKDGKIWIGNSRWRDAAKYLRK